LLRHHRLPKNLYKKLSEDPEFFIEILKLLYRAEEEEPGELSEEQRIRASLSFELLNDWKWPPGTNEDGSSNPERLKPWIRRARELAYASGRGKVADRHIGQVLVHYPSGTDGAWPHEALRDLLEDLSSKDIEEGISIGVYNGRGVVTRSIGEGGNQERAIAERYRNFAHVLGDRWPRTSRLIKEIAGRYEAESCYEDKRAELDEDLYR
jgi:hypothetical protein